ncbi:MAG: MauE/DoxX family redox-associated membrane protein [Bacteroidota bacterium]
MEIRLALQKLFWSKKMMVDIVCYVYFILFLYAAFSKLLAYEKSQLQMSKSPVITNFASILVWLVPVIEIVIATLLITKKTIMLGLYAALALMIMFTAYIIAILNFSDTVPCSCGGVLEKLGWTEHLLFNLAFMLLAIIAILLQTKIKERNVAYSH